MLHFAAGVSCRVFHLRGALVLHHASTWATINDEHVTVIRLGDFPEDATIATGADLFVELTAPSESGALLATLRDYLAHVLGPEYLAVLEADRIHVTWGTYPPAG